MSEITEGTELYWPPSRYSANQGRSVRVEKIGRKWMALSNGSRADKNTLRVDQDYGEGVVLYLSREAYEIAKERQARWREIKAKIDRMYYVPDDVNIEAIARHLGMHP